MTITTEIKEISSNPFWAFLHRIERGAAFGMLMILAILPVIDAILRTFFHSGVPYGQNFLDALIIPLTFAGVALCSREKRHMAISIGLQDREGIVGAIARKITALGTGIVVGIFFWSSLEYIVTGFKGDEFLFFVPIILFALAFPVGMLVVVVRTFPAEKSLVNKVLYIIGLALSCLFALASIVNILDHFHIIPAASFGMEFLDTSWWLVMMKAIRLPLILFLLLGGIMGMPLFMMLGGIAALLFFGDGLTGAFAMSDGYAQLKTSSMPAIALFTFAGYLLSESKACDRLIRLFTGIFGRLPGGIIIIVVVISAFFTSFTGASGITILALGAVLLAILKNSGGNSDRLSIGLITGTGAIGLMFPPSLAIIIYGAVEMSAVGSGGGTPVNILQIFKAAVMPGMLFVLAMIIMGAIMSRREHLHGPKIVLPKMSGRETLAALRASIFELLLPVLVIVVFYTGLAGIVETAAFAAVYALIIEVFVKREITFKKLISISIQTMVIYGGILAILTFARGLSSYIVYTGFDQALVEFAVTTIKSPILFLLLLNIVLLILGSLMEVFTAIVIFVPLLTGVASAFGIHQAHLAVIFLTNLSVGFITPPFGLDLFLASYRFKRPVVTVFRDALPFVGIQFAVVLLVTYVPWFSLALL